MSYYLITMLKQLKQIISKYKLKHSIKLVRREMGLLGYPVNQFTDEELIKGVSLFDEIASQVGITTKEINKAFNSFC